MSTRSGSGRTQRTFGRALALSLIAGLALMLGAGCGGDKGSDINVDRLAVKDYKVEFPDPVPFNPEEWTTATDYPLIGDPRAKRDMQDRAYTEVWATFLPTLRLDGPNSGLVTSRTVRLMMYESLIGIHPETEEFLPALASHWKIQNNPDGKTQTFWFRIDEKARFSDGSPVTADDVQATWWHLTQEDRKDPSNVLVFKEGYEEPEIIDKYTVKVKTKKLSWRQFLYFGGMLIRPAKYLRIPGDKFLKEYNWRFMPGSGPYTLASSKDLKKGDSLTITRRTDWWAENERWAKHCYNFGKIRFLVVRDRELQYEKFKNGELDWFRVGRAQRWVQDVPKEKIVQLGHVKKRKIFSEAPEGYAGITFNMRRPPFDDKKVRLAFCHLFNREKLFEKLFFNEYDYIDSYFPGRDWGDPEGNEKIRFDPDRAEELLAEAGYTKRDEEGYLLGPDGKRFEVTMRYGAQGWERIWLVVKEDYENAGIKFNLELMDGSTLIKKISQRQFGIHFQSWGALLFPNPETSWRSDLADKDNNNNIPGFKSDKVDALLKTYDVTFDRAKQKEIIREIDRLVFAEHPYALGWYAGHNRILYWDRFGQPDTYFTRVGQVPERDAMILWWFDEEKNKALEAARKSGEKLPLGEEIVKPWAKKN
ncbi:MAG: ABC transporter substrate-binding protein [Planctomycetota bacterium]|nr:ABC transporter substrate-binding protein [Planctomycetota bacterium]